VGTNGGTGSGKLFLFERGTCLARMPLHEGPCILSSWLANFCVFRDFYQVIAILSPVLGNGEMVPGILFAIFRFPLLFPGLGSPAWESIYEIIRRGRNASFPAPPAQIPT
jgi:hypothetical protein